MWYKKWCEAIFWLLLTAWVLYTVMWRCFHVNFCQVVSVSMQPTLHDGDVILCRYFETPDQATSMLSKGDIVLIEAIDGSGKLWVKRVHQIIKRDSLLQITHANIDIIKGLVHYDGGRVVVRNDGVYVNGQRIETYRPHQNFYFVVGDNVSVSYDSRNYGYVPQSKIVGRVWFLVFSYRQLTLSHFFSGLLLSGKNNNIL